MQRSVSDGEIQVTVPSAAAGVAAQDTLPCHNCLETLG